MRDDVAKRAAVASLVKLLFHERDDRGMRLIEHATRCVQRQEIHEIVTTDQRDLAPGDRVDRVGFIGFAEFSVGGVVERGDTVLLDGRSIGVVAGFDECHFPNHYNVLIESRMLLTGADGDIGIGSELRFQPEPVVAAPSSDGGDSRQRRPIA